jgi:peptidoglycan/LPS O-acetylase OafA/YrhL
MTTSKVSEVQSSNDRVSRTHIYGLDTIRFFCALWVVLGHFDAPPLPGFIDKSTLLGLLTVGIYNNLTSGPAAVIVFFIVSGLCIHFPQAVSLSIPNGGTYLVRRYLRIVPPMLVAIAIAQWIARVNLSLFHESILWSLFAELVYYTIYPALLTLRRQLGSWWSLFAVSFVAALAVAATNPSAGDYPSYGLYLNWLLGLPCWLLGCILAEQFRRGRIVHRLFPVRHIWLWRAAILLLASACSIARFHTPIGYPWTLNFFALFATIWLYIEIVRFADVRPPALFEWAGSWSYSLYLFHPIGIALYKRSVGGEFDGLAGWCLCMSFILGSSYVFAVLVEFTSHRLARAVASAMPPKRQVARAPAG